MVRVGQFAKRLGAQLARDGNDAELSELNEAQSKARLEMEAVFEPLKRELQEHSVNWEYMTWKVGMDSPQGRLNIEVRKSGKLYIRLKARGHSADELTRISGIEWRQGSQESCFADMDTEQLLSFLRVPAPTEGESGDD